MLWLLLKYMYCTAFVIESLVSVAALVTDGGQVDPQLPSNSPEALYDCLKPKMSDMPSPPLPGVEEKDESAHPYGVLHITRGPSEAKPKPCKMDLYIQYTTYQIMSDLIMLLLVIRDESFTGKYTFEDG